MNELKSERFYIAEATLHIFMVISINTSNKVFS